MADNEMFKLKGPRIEEWDYARIGREIGVREDVIRAVVEVEAASKGTDSKGRLKALYEPHVAYRNSKGATREKLIAAGLAYPKWKKGYPADSYPRILKAYDIDPEIALRATSWGLPQILGENASLAGYASAAAMVSDFTKDEDNQIEAMIRFVKKAVLDVDLRILQAMLDHGQTIEPKDCIPFVKGYNGAGYAANGYHTKLAAALNKWAKIPDVGREPPEDLHDEDAPDSVIIPADYRNGRYHEVVYNVQMRLDELGYPEVGSVDGKWGSKTQAAVLAFRADNDLPLAREIDHLMLAALMIAKPRVIAEKRANATMAELREEGAEDVAAADTQQIVGGIAGAGGAVVAAGEVLDQVEGYSGLLKRAADIVEPVKAFIQDNVWLLLIGVGVVVVWQSGVLKNIRLKKHQTGQDVSR